MNRFSFIPSVSAMAMNFTNNEINWYEPMGFNDTGTTTNGIMTPFDNWYMPQNNENHVQLTQENVEFALNEILDFSLENQELEEILKFQIAKNPVDEYLIIMSNKNIEKADFYITDLTGKSVFSLNNLTLSERQIIPLNIQSGLYILEIRHNEQTFHRQKIIKR